MRNRLDTDKIGVSTSYLLFIATIMMLFACSEEEDPFTSCISYDETVKYTKGAKIILSSCSEGAVLYEWSVEDSTYSGSEVEHIITRTEGVLSITLTTTNSDGNNAYENVRINLETVPYKIHSFDHSLFSIGNVGLKEGEIFVKGYFANNQGTFGAYLSDRGTLLRLKTYDNEGINLYLNEPILYPTQGGFFTYSSERTDRILADEGYFFRELVLPRFNDHGEYQDRSLTLVPVDGGVEIVEKSDGYYVAADFVNGATTLATIDKDGNLISSTQINSELSEETYLVDFLKNKQGGYCLILQDRESKTFIRLNIDEQGSKVDEYQIPIDDVPNSKLSFFVDGTRLIVTEFYDSSSGTRVNVINESFAANTFYTDLNGVKSIVDGGDGKYLLIDRSDNISLISTTDVEYTIKYDLGEFKAVLRMADSYYLIGRATSEYDKIPLYVLRVGLDGLVQ